MKIRLNIDSVGYTNKPQGVTVAGIRNRLCTASSIREVEPEQFITAVKRGRSWTPAAMTGTTSDTWQSQQVIAADVDNGGKDATGNKVCIHDPLTPDQAIEVLGRYSISPYFMYYSFSNSDTWPRYRVVLILDQALTDQHEAKDLTARLANVLNEARPGCTDTTIADNARLLFAGRADSAFYQSKKLTALDTLRRLPEIRKPEPPQRITRPTPTAAMMAGNEARIMDALKAIPCSSTSREQWVSVGMAINSMGWPFEVWDEWSASDPTRYSQRECLKIWRSFKPGKGIDHTFIIHLATENGWTPPRKQPPTPTRSETKGEAMQEHDQEQPQEITETTAEPDTTQATTEQTTAKPSQVVLRINRFKTRLYEPIPTGTPEIDKVMGGGFFVKQLVTMGAHPGAGKTLVAQQLFDGMAQAGNADILFFNLEMDADQLFARSISRETNYTALEIMQGYKWTEEQEQRIIETSDIYEKTTAAHIQYNPALKKEQLNDREKNSAHYLTIYDTMVQFAEERKAQGVTLPLVCVVDYLQILQGDPGMDDVTIIKKSLQLYKDFARTYDAVVFLIMAHSRATNQDGTPTQGAGRDTSNIEYSGDVQLSLNYTAVATGDKTSVKAFEMAIRNGETEYTKQDITLTVTKGRFIPSDSRVFMKIDGEHSRFTVVDADTLPKKKKAKQQKNSSGSGQVLQLKNLSKQ